MAKTFDELRREMTEKYGGKTTSKSSSKDTDSRLPAVSEDTKRETASSFSSLRSEMNEKYNRYANVSESFVNKFISDANTFMKADDSSAYKTWNSLDLGSRIDTFRGWLWSNRDKLDEETYKSLHNTVGTLTSLRDYYAGFETEDDYTRSSIGWLDIGGEKTAESVAKRQEYYQSNQDRIDAINEELPWYANTWLPNGIEDIFLSKEKESLRDEAEALKADNLKYERTQGVTDKYYTPVTEEFTQNAAYRDYSNASMEEIAEHDAVVKTIKAKNLGYDYDGNMVDATGRIVYAADHPVVKAMRENDLGGYYDTIVEDKLGMYLSASEEDLELAYERLLADNQYDTWAILLNEGETHAWKELTEGEIDIYYNLYKTQGQTAAYQYLKDMETELTRRATQKRADEISEAGLLEQLALNAASIPMNVIGGVVGLIGDAADAIKGESYNPYSAAHSWSNDASAIRQDTAADINKATGNAALPWVGTTFGDVYQSIMSFGDSVMASYIPGGAALLGTNAATAEMKELYERGASTEQLLAGGILAGAAEMFFESVSIGELEKIKNMDLKDAKNAVDILVRGVVMGGVEASEEMATEIANTITDAIVMGSQTDWVDMETFAKNVVNAGIGGFISGGFGGALGTAVNHVQYNSMAAEHGQSIIDNGGQESIDALKQLALEMYSNKGGVDALRGIKAVNKVADKATAKNVGRLSDQIESTISKQNRTDVQTALVKQGLSKNEAALVSAYITNSNELTPQQVTEVETNARFQSAMDEVLADPELNISDNGMKLTLARNGVYEKKTPVKQAEQSEASAQQPQAIAATENAPVEQPAAESEFSVSETGKTTYNGAEVKVAGVASVENGEVMVRLDNGEVVNARDVEFGREDDALLYEAVADMGMDVDAANDYIQGFNSMKGFPLATPQSVSSYMLGFREAHTYGRLGIPSEALARDGKYSVELSDGQRQIAYNRGSIERINEAKAAQSAVSEKTVKANKTYKDETHVSKIKSSKAYKNLSDTQKASLDGLTAIYKALGIDVYLFESPTDAKGRRLGKNGYYNPEDKSVHIDLYAGNDGRGTMIFTTGHELTHFIKDLSPEKFEKFADILFERLEKEGHSVAALIAKKKEFLKKHGRITPEMSETEANDLAREEAVADACETMLADGEAFAEIAERIHAKDKGLWNAIKKFFNDLVAKIKNAYAGLDPDSIVGQQVAEMLDTAEELRSLWVDMLVEASEVKNTLREVVEADAKPISNDEIITDGAVVTDGNGTKYSIRSMKHDISDGQMFRDLMTHCGFTKEQVGELRRQLEDLVEYMNPYRDIVDLNETYGREGRRYSPYKPNSDPLYTISLDFSTQCSKRLLTQYVIEQLQLRENRPMSPEEQMAIRDMLKEYGKVEKGLQVACVMCYVEAARLKAPKQIQKWLDDPSTAMRNFFADKNPEFSAYIKEKQADFKESRGYDRDATKKDMSAKDRNALNKIRPRLRAEYNPSADEQAIIDIAASLPNSTYLTAGNLADLSETHPEIYKAYTSFIRTATRSKALETDEPYYYGDSTRDNGNGIIVSDSFIEAVNRENGMRFSSWSDWRIQHMLDWITAVIDNSVRGAAMHGYTKYGDEVRVLGKTGMMFNMSGVAGTQTGLNEDGSLNFSETESMDYDEAIELREEFPETAGLQCIGVGMDHIFALLRSDVIDYVIPYHTSGLNATLRRMGDIYGWKDFTYAQHATEDKRIKKENAVDPDHWHQEPVFSEFFVGYDTGLGGVEAMRKSAENYKRMCRDRGLTPKFNEFANEPNYWKLLIDRKMVNQKTNALIRQRAVTPDFDFGVIKGIVDKYVANYDSGLEQRAFNHIVENWDNIPKRIRDLKKQGSAKTKSTKKAIYKLANEPVAVQPKEGMKASDRDNFVEDKYFKSQMTKWEDLKHGSYVKVGTIGKMHPLYSVGMPEGTLRYDVDKLKKNMADHGDYLNVDLLKAIPDIIADPIAISEYSAENTVSVFGNIFIGNSPMMVGVTISKDRVGNDISKVRTYNTRRDVGKLITDETILYLNEDKKRTRKWFQACGIQVPLGEAKFGFIRSIAQNSNSVKREFSDADIKYSIREEAPPKNTMEGYKVFVVKNGKLYPPMVANPNAEDTPVGVWLNADVGTRAPDSKTGRMQVKAGGKGTQGGSGSLAFRPGWHLGETPLATQFDRLNPETGVKELFPENFVWALCDIAADHDYQEEAMSYGYTKNGKFQHSLAGLPKLPTDGYYKYRTNPNPDTVPWLITGAMKVKKLLSDAEVNAILAEKGLPPKQRVGGDKTLADLGLSEYDGNLYSDRDPDSISTRELLANALESVAQNDIERAKLAQYKRKIALIEEEQAKLAETKAKIKELSFAKGRRDTEAIKKLQFEANQSANRINTYDRQLLTLESTAALKGVLEREKKLAYQRAERKGKEALARQRERDAVTQRELLTRYQESRKKGVEGRRKTEMRHKIKNVVSELNQYLLKGTKDKHVPIGLQASVAEALNVVNMDTVGAQERLAEIHAKLQKDPFNHELLERYRRISEQGERMDAKLQAFKNAYDEILNSDDPLVANSHDEVISNSIANVMKVVGDTPIRDMSLTQLEMVYDLYKMVLTTIRNTNKAFKAAKGEEISTIANGVIAELDAKKKNPMTVKGLDTLSEFDWNNLKPVYAFERIGSANFTKVFNAVRAGEDVWAKDMSEAQAFREEQFKKHNYRSFDFDKKYEFATVSGEKFELTLGEIMSLYAYAKDEDAKNHLFGDGFAFDPKKKVVKKVKGVIKVVYNVEDATSYKLNEEILAKITATLTPEQKAFADAMQDYLSNTMGEKGNEVSLALYGIKLFKNKVYFPLKVSHQYMAIAKEKAEGKVRVKNKGFTNERKKNAKNTVILTSFMDVWADHVNEMSMYHAFTLPLEDFRRVLGYTAPGVGGLAPVSVRGTLINAHGNAAEQYLDQFFDDINGGARSDPRETFGKALMSNFKKAAVMASLSVVIQQPSAIVRATALIDAKYFAGNKVAKGKHKEMWEEVKKYAPVAIIKEMGYFDTGMGKSSVEWLKGDKTWMDKVDDAVSKAPSLADELTWVAIWSAVKRETLHTYKHLQPNSDAFLQAAGERFTEVITKTQVYDSTLSRSANMRSKGAFMNMVTSFMAEPTTSINMLQDAFQKGNKKRIARTLGAVYGSVLLNSALVSLIYAMRDDDEDETFLEKYLSRFVTEVVDGLNPLTYIPFFKDIWSAAQGFDIERADMSLITETIDSLQQLVKVASKDTSDFDEDELAEHKKAVAEALMSIADTISSLVGVPVKNVRRDLKGIINFFGTIGNGLDTTAGSLADIIGGDLKDSVPVWGWFPDVGKEDKLYDAIIKGDTAYVDRLKSGYKSDNAYHSAIRAALRENDPRIHEAAVAKGSGKIAEYTRIAKAIIAEGRFKQDDVVAAINAEINSLNKSEPAAAKGKAKGLYEMDDYFAALIGRDQASAYAVKEDIIKTAVANGKNREDAEDSFLSSFASGLKERYEDGEVSYNEAINMLVNYGEKTEESAEARVQYWEFKEQYPNYDLSEDAVTKYYAEAEPSGIGIRVYYDYSKQRAKCKGVDENGDGRADSGSVKSEVLDVIDSLSITSEQKDVLYYLNGWSASTISDAPWH